MTKAISTFCVRYAAIIILLLFGWVSAAQAETVIKINRGADDPVRIAISPITEDGAPLPQDVSNIVSEDLKRSGLFSPIARMNMLSYPGNISDVYYRDWRVLGAEYLVVGEAKPLGAKIEITYSLVAVHGERKVFTKVVSGAAADIRKIAHTISDEVYQAITGIPGAFATRIAYVVAERSSNGRRYRLMMSDADGARETLLLESKKPIMSPTWSPDARQLAYVSFETGRPAIYRQNVATAEREQLTRFKGLNGAPSWSPDGKKLAMVLSKDGNPEIYVYDFASRKFTRITKHFGIDTEPNWTPDGKNLVFTSDRGGSAQIYQVNLSSRAIKRITFKGKYNARPRLAPNGRTLVMVHRDQSRFHIASQDLKNGDMRILTQTSLDESPTVAPNGAMLLYATKQGDKGVLAAVSLDAGVKFFLPARAGDVREPAWSPK